MSRPRAGVPLAWLVTMAALLQGGILLHWAARQVPAVARIGALFAPESPPPARAQAAVAAQRALPALAERIPHTAHVLLVTRAAMPVQFEAYFVPRPFTYLQRLPEDVVRRAAAHAAVLGPPAAAQLRTLESRGLLYTPERLRQRLSRADYLVSFFGDELLPQDGPSLELLARVEAATLYRVVRD